MIAVPAMATEDFSGFILDEIPRVDDEILSFYMEDMDG
jgi:hypothetical protein